MAKNLRTQKWQQRYEELKDYQRNHGHCNVPATYEDNPTLAKWVITQRISQRKELLTAEREKKLDDIGFAWRLRGSSAGSSSAAAAAAATTPMVRWQQRFEELEAYKRMNGHCNVPVAYEDNPALGQWVATQRTSHRKETLAAERKLKLDSIGFAWKFKRPVGPSMEGWQQRLEELKAYKQMYGNCNVHLSNDRKRNKDFPGLGTWVYQQRRFYEKGELLEDRRDLLEQIGFIWAPFRSSTSSSEAGADRNQSHDGDVITNSNEDEDTIWQQRYDELKVYKQTNGNCNVPLGNRPLGQWVNLRRQEQRENRLSDDRKRQLDEIGFTWGSTSSMRWQQRYQELKEYKDDHGNCNVPVKYEDNPALAFWVKTQRVNYKNETLAADRIKQLNEIGFSWKPRDSKRPLGSAETWQRRYEELKAYNTLNGNCNVPSGYTGIPGLGDWVRNQRRLYKKDVLTAEFVNQLNDIGFTWRLEKTAVGWQHRYEELKAFKEINGHCNVPKGRTENLQLGDWVCHQRRAWRKGELSEDRKKMLDEIGFAWKLQKSVSSKWQQHYEELKSFKEINGHFYVPQKYKENPALAEWVKNQRREWRRGTQGEVRKALLEQIGVNWRRGSGEGESSLDIKWRQRYDELKTYAQVHGSCNVPQQSKDYFSLGQWVKAQRQTLKWGKLTEQRKDLLDQIGFSWKLLEKSSRRSEIRSSSNDIPKRDSKVGNTTLKPAGNLPWISFAQVVIAENESEERNATQVAIAREKSEENDSSTKPAERDPPIAPIEIGITKKKSEENTTSPAPAKTTLSAATLYDITWQHNYDELKAYKQLHGNCNVPRPRKEKSSLGNWVEKQRRLFKKGELSKDRKDLLDQLRFTWSLLPDLWQQRYGELKSFKNDHGHCNVPRRWVTNPQLAKWVNKQRQEWKSKRMPADRIDLLGQIGFMWEPFKGIWHQRYGELKSFQTEHGHCNVPKGYDKYPKLLEWVLWQHRRNNIPTDQINLLEQIGFDLKSKHSSSGDELGETEIVRTIQGSDDIAMSIKDSTIG